METLRPTLAALGFDKPEQQRAYAKLLEATGCLPAPTTGRVSDAQADAILDTPVFTDAQHALDWLHRTTQSHWLRPKGLERYQVQDGPGILEHRGVIADSLVTLRQTDPISPRRTHYDHVLILGAMEGTVQKRLRTLIALAEQGVTFGHIHLLGCQRPLRADHESSAGTLTASAGGDTETGMMLDLWHKAQPILPPSLRATPATLIDTPNHPDGSRAITVDTVASWVKTNPTPGHVLMISDQPHIAYQHAAAESKLPAGFMLETVGAAAERGLPLVLTLDALARQTDVSLPRLKTRMTAAATHKALENVHMIPIETIDTNPEMFQFRSGCDTKGESAAHQMDGKWNPLLHAAPLLLYAARDGALEVVDGHHRLAFARRAQEQGEGPNQLPARILFEHDGITREEARAIGVYANLAQEFARPEAPHNEQEIRDAARVFHLVHHGKARPEVLPQLRIQGSLAEAYQAGALSDPAFAYVERGQVPVAMAAQVPQHTDRPDTQVDVMQILSHHAQIQGISSPF